MKLDIGHVNFELVTATKRIAELQGKYNAHMNKQKNDAKRVFRRVNAERKEFMSSQELLDSAAINLSRRAAGRPSGAACAKWQHTDRVQNPAKLRFRIGGRIGGGIGAG